MSIIQAALQARFIYLDTHERSVFATIGHSAQIDVQRKGVFEPYFEFSYKGERKMFDINLRKAFSGFDWEPVEAYWTEFAKTVSTELKIGNDVKDEYVFPKGVLHIWSGSDEYIILGDAYDGQDNIPRRGFLHFDRHDKSLVPKSKGTIVMPKDDEAYKAEYKGPVIASMTRKDTEPIIAAILADKNKVFVHNTILHSQHMTESERFVHKGDLGRFFSDFMVAALTTPHGDYAGAPGM